MTIQKVLTLNVKGSIDSSIVFSFSITFFSLVVNDWSSCLSFFILDCFFFRFNLLLLTFLEGAPWLKTFIAQNNVSEIDILGVPSLWSIGYHYVCFTLNKFSIFLFFSCPWCSLFSSLAFAPRGKSPSTIAITTNYVSRTNTVKFS